MNKDDYNEVVNGEDTYQGIADVLREGHTCLISWSDQRSSHFDILFTWNVPVFGSNLQGGVRGKDLFVSVMRKGAFGFDVIPHETHPSYYAEKLHLGNDVTTDALAKLVNEVRARLWKLLE